MQDEVVLIAVHSAVSLTACADTWLEHAPDEAEQRRIDAAFKQVREQRRLAIEIHKDSQATKLFSLALFRRPAFHPLHLDDWLIEQILHRVGEPPLVEDIDDPVFATYLRQAVLSIATARVRRSMAAQLRRFLPIYVEAGEWKEAVIIDHNAFCTSLGNEVSPFLVQMTLGGLARWYNKHEH